MENRMHAKSLFGACLLFAAALAVSCFCGVSAAYADGDGWQLTDAGEYQYIEAGVPVSGRWIVTDQSPTGADKGHQRYWINGNGILARDTVIREEEAGWNAYATPTGAVVRGSYAASGQIAGDAADSFGQVVYVADNDGRIPDAGWVVSDAYGHGLQRYWIDPDTLGCNVGFSYDGWPHYTTEDGYVLRGAIETPQGKFIADNDGRIAVDSWMVTGAFTGGNLERYWVSSDGCFATDTLIDADQAGYYAYATSNGPVVRGMYAADNGNVYIADNDGKLVEGGWLVGDYGQGVQRYWVDEEAHACVPGLSSDGWPHYTLEEGYVLRTMAEIDDEKYVADNDGLLLTNGWVITDFFTGSMERFWAGESGCIATNAFIPAEKAGWNAYAKADGTVVRGTYAVDGKLVYIADNDGRIPDDGWVEGDYGYGTEHYYVDPQFHACVIGFSESGEKHYTTDKGFVARGIYSTEEGIIFADSEGVLLEDSLSEGWNVTDKIANEFQRYYMKSVDGHLFAQVGFFEAELSGANHHFYGRPDTGCVLRGKYNNSVGVLLADNDGVLVEDFWTNGAGWMVTDHYDAPHLQRYYMQVMDGHLMAKTGMFEVDDKEYLGYDEEGYVARNETVVYSGKRYSADNDGVLTYMGTAGRDELISVVTWANDGAYHKQMVEYANRIGSKTDWFITTDYDQGRLCVLHRDNGQWSVVQSYNCGLSPRRWAGVWTIEHKQICNWADRFFSGNETWPGNDWSTCFIESYRDDNPAGVLRYIPGKGYEDCASIHSCTDGPVDYSHEGCTGILARNAKWIYDNVDVGSTLYFY